MVGVVRGGGVDDVARLLTAAVSGAVVLIGVALGNRAGCGGKCQRGGGELIHTVVAEGELGGGIAAELPLPGGDVAVRQIAVLELAEDAGGVGSVGKMGDGLEAVVTARSKIAE